MGLYPLRIGPNILYKYMVVFLSSYNNQILRVTKCEKAAKAGSFQI